MSSKVQVLWRDIERWLKQNSPKTAEVINPPSAEEHIAMVSSAFTRSLPNDLLEWWRITDGVRPGGRPFLPPGFAPLECQATIEIRTMLINGSNKAFGYLLPDEYRDIRAAAGAPIERFLEDFLPFADNGSGDYFFVDLRDGEDYGCVCCWMKEGGWNDGILWNNVTDMLWDTRNALVYGYPALVSYAGRRLRHFEGMNVGAEIYRVKVNDDDYLLWEADTIRARTKRTYDS